MAERAHPDDRGFRRKKEYSLFFKRGVIPWIKVTRNPYSSEFYWRYRWASSYCRNKVVVDIPCGMGWGTSLIKNTRDITGIDISDEAIREAKSRYGRTINFRRGSMEELPFENECIDVVLCLEGIEHVTPKIGKKFISEAHRVLREDGTLLISSPQHQSRQHSGNPYHVVEYSPVELMTLLYSKFDTINMQVRSVDSLNVHYFTAIKRIV